MKSLTLKAGKNRSSLAIANNELAEMLTSYRESLTNAVATGSCAMRYNTEYGYGKHYYNADQLADRINLIDGMIKEL